MSNLSALYAALAAGGPAFTFNTQSITVYAPASLKESYEKVDLPIRVLIPLGNDADARQGQFVNLGSTLKMLWSIPDLMLLQLAQSGSGLADYAPALISYCGAYADWMRTMRSPASQCALENLDIAPGIYEWPAGSKREYAGVLCLVQYTEVLS